MIVWENWRMRWYDQVDVSSGDRMSGENLGGGDNHKQLENSRIIKETTYNGLFCLQIIRFTGRTSPSIGMVSQTPW